MSPHAEHPSCGAPDCWYFNRSSQRHCLSASSISFVVDEPGALEWNDVQRRRGNEKRVRGSEVEKVGLAVNGRKDGSRRGRNEELGL